jgi:hypothetical protein
MNPLSPLGDRDVRLHFAGDVLSTAGSGTALLAAVAAAFRRMPVEAVEAA